MEERPPRRRAQLVNLPSIVFARAEEAPEEPALFYPEGLDVRWRSWGAMAEQVAAGAAALTELGLPIGERVAFRSRGGPDAVAADLAIQAAGLVAVPVVEPPEAAEAGCSAWLVEPGDAGPEGDLPVARLPGAPDSGAETVTPAPGPAPGGARVGGGIEGGASLGQAELLERAEDLGRRLERAASGAAAVVARAGRPSGAGAGAREIVLASLDVRTADGRTVLAWALTTGAALFLEPDPRVLPGSAEWARPTLVAGEARALAELGRRLRAREPGRPGLFRRRRRSLLPFGRLRLLLVVGDGRLAVDDVAFWAGRGVGVVRVRA